MKISAEQLERYLWRKATPEEVLGLEAKLVLYPEIRDDLQWQQQTYSVVRQYGRQQLRSEIRAAERQLFHSPQHRSFQRIIRRLFLKR